MDDAHKTITILLADDHPIVRHGLRTVLEAEPDLRLVGETGDGLEAVALVERLQPDVLIVDLMMPGLGGLEVTRQVRQRAPRARVIVLSMHADEPFVREALKNGATGYVLKNSNLTSLGQIVREVAAGRHYLSPPLNERAIEAYVQLGESASEDPYETLTPREREVLHLLAEGLNKAAVAERLVLSPRTVEGHRASLMRKLGLHSQTDLVRYALKRGLLPSD